MTEEARVTKIRRTSNLALSPDRVIKLAETLDLAADARERIIELAGHWKHGFIPLDAVAYAIKMKQAKGDGKRRVGIKRGSQNDREAFKGEGSPSAPKPRERTGKSRRDVNGTLRAAAETAGRRKSSPPARASKADDDLVSARAEIARRGRAKMEEIRSGSAGKAPERPKSDAEIAKLGAAGIEARYGDAIRRYDNRDANYYKSILMSHFDKKPSGSVEPRTEKQRLAKWGIYVNN